MRFPKAGVRGARPPTSAEGSTLPFKKGRLSLGRVVTCVQESLLDLAVMHVANVQPGWILGTDESVCEEGI